MDEEMKMLTEVDPVSGNEVPPGSLPEEVRDDIDAKLSEGEYVVPADVLRFYGVKFFEELREKAKMELAEMNSEGRIGGASVEMPEEGMDMEMDNMIGMAEGGMVNKMPSASVGMDVTDDTDMLLDQFMDVVKNNPDVRTRLQKRGMNYAEGGVVTKDAILQTMQSMMNQGKVGFAEGGTVEAPTFNPANYGLGFSLFGNTEPFSPDTNVELTEYVNDAGQSIMIRTVDGVPIDQIPAGYYLPGNAPDALTPTNSSEGRDRDMQVTPTVQTATERNTQPAKDYFSMSAEDLEKEMNTSRTIGKGATIAANLLTGGIGGTLLGGAASAFGKGRIVALGDVASQRAQALREAGDLEGAAEYERVAGLAEGVSGVGVEMASQYYLNRWQPQTAADIVGVKQSDTPMATAIEGPTATVPKSKSSSDRSPISDRDSSAAQAAAAASKTAALQASGAKASSSKDTSSKNSTPSSTQSAAQKAQAAADKLGKPLATGGRATGGLVTKRKK